MSTFKGDFLGFSYNGVHCSELGIFRVSSGDRYQIHLSPTSKLQTVEVPGADGTYYFGKRFTQKTFKIDFAFDHVNDEQLRRIKQLLSTKGIHELIFDEEPYKVWDVQINGIPQLKTIPFDEGNIYESFGEAYNTYLTQYGERIYKGEGSIDFICYSPWAHSPKGKKYLSDYPEWEYENRSQWAAASGLPEDSKLLVKIGTNEDGTPVYTEENYNEIIIDETIMDSTFGHLNLFNAGDVDTPVKLRFFSAGEDKNINISLFDDITPAFEDRKPYLALSIPQDKIISNGGIEIDTKTQLIKQLNSEGEFTGVLLNRYITYGFPKKMKGGLTVVYLNMGNVDTETNPPQVFYEYLYN